MIRFVVCCSLFVSISAMAQVNEEDIIENTVQNTDAEFENEMLIEDLQQMILPINDTTANYDLFYQYGLLTPLQATQIKQYIKTYGELLTLNELIAIPTLSSEDIRRIKPFVSLSRAKATIPILKQLKQSRGLLVVRSQQLLEKQRGFLSINGEPPRYAGNKQRHYVKARITYQDQLSIGFLADKDAGEDFFTNTNKTGFDFYSGHIAYKPGGIVKQFVVGDYEIKAGQGLVQWNGFSLGKGADATSVFLKSPLSRPYTSSNERNFLRGITSTFTINKNIDATVWASRKRIDANRVNDSLDLGFTSIQTSGLHRTAGEIADEKSIQESLTGINITYQNQWLQLGLTGQQTSFSDSLVYRNQDYQKYFPRGNHFTHASVHYSAVRNRMYFFGESAINQSKAFAHIHGLQYFFHSGVKGILVYRNYDKGYQSNYANALGEASTVGNEKGIYVGLQYSPVNHLSVDLYYDRFAFPWQRFRVSKPSKGSELFMRATYRPSELVELELRSQYEEKEINRSNQSAPINELTPQHRNNNRLEFRYRPNKTMYLKSRIGHSYFSTTQKQEHGFLLFQDFVYSFPKQPIKTYGRLSLFHTDSFDSRVYAYENDLLYNFNVPAYFGKGVRYYAMVSAEPHSKVKLWIRASQTRYSDRETISSGNDEIDGNTRSDIKLQVQWKF